LALFGFVFLCPAGRFIAIISFHIRLCANLPRRQIGFVFLCPAGRFIAIISFHIRLCANLPRRQIGFVFSTWVFNPQKIWGLNNIGFDWVCLALFFAAQNRQNHQNLHNSFLLMTLCHIAHINIGFVFSN